METIQDRLKRKYDITFNIGFEDGRAEAVMMVGKIGNRHHPKPVIDEVHKHMWQYVVPPVYSPLPLRELGVIYTQLEDILDEVLHPIHRS
jgi:hypothetical protein